VAAYQVAPQAGFAHGGVGGLPRPIDAVQLITGLHQHRPQAVENTRLTPVLEVSMHGAVIPTCLRKAVPLASRAQPKDEAMEDASPVDSPMSLGLRGIIFVHNHLHHRPHRIWNLPDGGHLLLREPRVVIGRHDATFGATADPCAWRVRIMPHATAAVVHEPMRVRVTLSIFGEAPAQFIAGAVRHLAVRGQEPVAAHAGAAAQLVIAATDGTGVRLGETLPAIYHGRTSSRRPPHRVATGGDEGFRRDA
jgi:hypothetical protein